jgi:hypothetical protein
VESTAVKGKRAELLFTSIFTLLKNILLVLTPTPNPMLNFGEDLKGLSNMKAALNPLENPCW